MNTPFVKSLLLPLAISASIGLVGCGDAKTTITEKDPIVSDDDDHDHGGGEPGGTSAGRLLVVNAADQEADVFDLSDSDLLSTIALDAVPSAVYATGGFRFAALIERSEDKVGFIDGGLWQEPHDDHFDLFTTMPSLSNFTLTGSRPTHFVTHDGQAALFLDGDAGTGAVAGVQVFDDHMIEAAELPLQVEFTMPQHGVAEPRGEHLLATIRREDALSTSGNFILPDQVGVYHLHDGEYELEQTFAETCPDLHGAAQNETHIIFGCSDGVLLVTDNGDDTYSAQKIANSAEVFAGLRIGSIWGHPDSAQFIGQASSRGSDEIQLFVIDPEAGEMALLDWQPVAGAKPVVRAFAFEAEQFLLLDDQGYLTAIEPHQENGQVHWEFGARLDITEADVALMPDGAKFSMTLAQNGHTAYIADPIAQHVLIVDLEVLAVTAGIELDYEPAMITWLGIPATH